MLEAFAWFAGGASACWLLIPSRRDVEFSLRAAIKRRLWNEAVAAFDDEDSSQRAWALVDAICVVDGEQMRSEKFEEEDTEEENEDQ